MELSDYVVVTYIYISYYGFRSIRMEFEDMDAMMRGVAILVNRNLLQM